MQLVNFLVAWTKVVSTIWLVFLMQSCATVSNEFKSLHNHKNISYYVNQDLDGDIVGLIIKKLDAKRYDAYYIAGNEFHYDATVLIDCRKGNFTVADERHINRIEKKFITLEPHEQLWLKIADDEVMMKIYKEAHIDSLCNSINKPHD